jgi:exonuclease III
MVNEHMQLITQPQLLKYLFISLTSISRWILGGDFNMICNLDEKRGRTRKIEATLGHFQGLIDKLGLIDMETTNVIFTWMNRRSGARQVACRLDHFLISDSPLMEGTTMEAHILDAHVSDHWPIQLWLDIPTSLG